MPKAKRKTKPAKKTKLKLVKKKPLAPKRKPLNTTSKKLIATAKAVYTHAVKPREMVVARGAGAQVWDLEGNQYIDLGAGISVTSLGHNNGELIGALTKQAKRIWHTSNIYYTEPPILLAQELVKASKFAKRVFYCNSGAEANEGAIKLARKYAADKGLPPESREIITFTGSFHGRTLATVTATAQPKYHAGFEPLPAGFRYVPFNDFGAVANAVTDKTCAILAEVVQGEGGITPMKPGFLKHLRQLCDKVDALLMLDQVQCGMGRTGHLFSHFAEAGVKPDTVSLAKALGGGMPIGALLIGEKAAETFQFGSHGTTFGGNPLACAVARVVLKKLQSPALQKNVQARGKQLFAALDEINKKHGIFADIRGRGLMIGAELKPQWHGKVGEITDAARKHGVLVLQAGPNVLRFLPPLTITEKELKEGIARLNVAVGEYFSVIAD
jgi:acetylornithine/N-succinyldiaminopimelate aminotransferase